MKSVYKLIDGKVVEFQKGTEVESYKDCNEFFNRDLNIDDSLLTDFETGLSDLAHLISSKKLKKEISTFVCSHFEKFFKDNKNEITETQLDEEEEKLEDKFHSFGEELYNEMKKNVQEKINNFLGNKTVNGGNMFKSIKEAKTFTAHLDALANEIESLDGVSGEMKKHLAYRLDRLSDLIETSSYQNEKKASADKEANGVGSGTWAQDSDEKYMNTFGGTGTLMGDSDESKYMKEFKGDDHQEVLNRKEPGEIQGAGAKKKQPSDNYNESEVASKLRNSIKSIMANLK